MSPLETQSGIPLYHQLRQVLSEKISGGEWKAGALIPSEKALESEFLVSRTTVRLALKELEQDGLINRQRGRGTFVCEPKIQHSPSPSLGLGDAVDRVGLVAQWRLVKAGLSAATDAAAQALNVTPGTLLFQIHRLRIVDGVALGWLEAFVGSNISIKADASALTSGHSLAYLDSELLRDGYASRTIDAIGATDALAQHLDIAVDSPLLRIRRTTFSKNGQPIEYLTACYRGDRFEYTIPNAQLVSN